jgi:ABC-type glutathione transport system ATPase component
VAEPLLEVKDMRVHFKTDDGIVKAVDGVSYSVQPGETLGIVGESGSGKSVSSLTVMGLTDSKYAEISGEVIFQGADLRGNSRLRAEALLRGTRERAQAGNFQKSFQLVEVHCVVRLLQQDGGGRLLLLRSGI